ADSGALEIVPIDLQTLIAVEAFVADMSDHAHYLSPRTVRTAAHALAEGTLPRPGQMGDLFIHHHDQRGIRRVLFGKRSSLEHRDAHRTEIIRRGGCFVSGFERTRFLIGSL